jgi:hypothetical protein
MDSIVPKHRMVRAMIIDRKLRVLRTDHRHVDHRTKSLGILQSIYLAVSADGRAIPNIEFVVSIDDFAELQPNRSGRSRGDFKITIYRLCPISDSRARTSRS